MLVRPTAINVSLQYHLRQACAMPVLAAMTDFISVSPEKKEELNQAVGLLKSRILGEACAKELKEVVLVEGIAIAKSSFAVFGELAMQEVMANPNVVAGLAGTAKYIDIAKINAVKNSKELYPYYTKVRNGAKAVRQILPLTGSYRLPIAAVRPRSDTAAAS
jgi:hypothetical protein